MSAHAPLARPFDHRLIGGVCSALSARYQIDVTLLRLAFLVLAFASGIGVVLYGVLWLVLPPRGSTHREELSRAGQALRGRVSIVRSRAPKRHATAIALVSVGTLLVLASFGAFAWLTFTRAAGIVVALVGAGMLLNLAGGQGR